MLSATFQGRKSMLQRTAMFVLLAYMIGSSTPTPVEGHLSEFQEQRSHQGPEHSGQVHDVARRPVYVIGHMANSLAYLDAFLAQGANAIEADLSFTDDGWATKFFHGEPCYSPLNCSAEEEVVPYLAYVRDTTSAYASKYYGKMLLFNIDVKTTGAAGSLRSAGASLATNLIEHLWSGVKPKDMMNVLISCYSPEDVEVLRSAFETISGHQMASVLLDHLGFDISSGKLSVIANIFALLGIKHHRWQGFGFSEKSWKDENYSRYVHRITRLRALPASTKNYVDKTYVYTVDEAPPVRLLLRHQIDGVVTNAPRVVLRVLADSEFTECCRLATGDDDPWKRIS